MSKEANAKAVTKEANAKAKEAKKLIKKGTHLLDEGKKDQGLELIEKAGVINSEVREMLFTAIDELVNQSLTPDGVK